MDPLQRTATRLGYGFTQGARVAWYTSQGIALRRLVARLERDLPPPKRRFRPPQTPTPGLSDLLRGVARLMAEDMAHVEAGLYPMPMDEEGGLPAIMGRARRFFEDAPKVQMRRREDRHQEVFEIHQQDSDLPRYYLQNFHFQTDGWLSRDSAELYDTQVDVLFHGATGAMRRMGVAEVVRALSGRDQRKAHLVDVATGTGAFLRDLTRALPRLRVTGIDLSDAYLDEARARYRDRPRIAFQHANAEAMPFSDASIDIVSSVFLFHELPPKVRRIVAREIFRVLKPGGSFVFVDSLQTDDIPAYNGLLETFPELFHEPYYLSYLNEDLSQLFENAGLKRQKSAAHFFSKVMTFTKP
ncbi:MAG: class I SAM-dependent methyltransferase [Rhizobiales bacterium]|nr:class I SAM-dependent methyltransferase [Hyphomicrobiales bacterium]